jgi:hypothetical protein
MQRIDFMLTPTPNQIESEIAQLPLADQLWLMERLAHRIRQRTLPALAIKEGELATMAADPAIQHELQQIEAEFGMTEMDGLGAEK